MITLELEREDVQSVLDALSDQPYKKVAGLIAKVMEQAQPQVNPQKPQPEEPQFDEDQNE